MPDVLTPSQRHRVMASIHSTSTKPEVTLRHALWHHGFRYRINDKHLPGKPDIVLPKYRTVVFMHGCFWHGHRDCKSYTIPKTNTEYWKSKVARNQERDQEVWRKLEADGWNVIIVWECQLKRANLEETVDKVRVEIIRNGELYQVAQGDRKAAREVYLQERKKRAQRNAAIFREINQMLESTDRTAIRNPG